MDASKRIGKMMLQMLTIVLIFAMLSMLYTLYRGHNTGADIAFTPEQISFLDPDGEEIVISYGEIVSIELLETPDYGEPTDGKIDNNTRVGAWRSEQLGDYITHTSTAIENCLFIKTQGASYAVNYENNETTAQLLEEIQKYL